MTHLPRLPIALGMAAMNARVSKPAPPGVWSPSPSRSRLINPSELGARASESYRMNVIPKGCFTLLGNMNVRTLLFSILIIEMELESTLVTNTWWPLGSTATE